MRRWWLQLALNLIGFGLFANPDPGAGDGGGTAPEFSISPLGPYSFGNTVPGTPVNMVLTITNNGDANLVVSSITLGGDSVFSKSGISLPKTITPGHNTTFTLTFSPVTAGSFNGTISIVHNASGSPYNSTMSGSASSPAGTGVLSITPSQEVFPDTVAGTTSSPMYVVLSNIGQGPLTITGLSLQVGTNFTITVQPQNFITRRLIPTWKKVKGKISSYMYMSSLTPVVRRIPTRPRRKLSWTSYGAIHSGLPIILAPGASIQVGIVFNPTTLGVLTDSFLIQTNLQGSPYSVPLQGNGVLLIPVAVITNNTRILLWAYVTQAVAVTHQQMSSTDFNSENASTLILNGALWNKPGEEKTLERVEIFYENFGVATITVSVTSFRPSGGADNFQTVSKSVTLGTALADGTERSTFADLTISGEILTLSVTRAALGGPVSLIAFQPHFQKRGEKVESS